MNSAIIKGAVFDMDGVITNTAKVHSRAWKQMFDNFLQKYSEKNSKPFIPFDHEKDYLQYVDGKPRLDGITSFLRSRGIDIPVGNKKDTGRMDTVYALGERKNRVFQNILEKEGVEIFNSSIKLINKLKRRGVKIGLATSSKNCSFVLKKAGLTDIFETKVDGVVSLSLRLKGKPAPDIFVRAAANMGLKPDECMMVEDALSGVQAGRNGNFALVVGVSREISRQLLRKNGADIAVKDLGELNLKDIDRWLLK